MELNSLQVAIDRTWTRDTYSVGWQTATTALPHLGAAHAAAHLIKAAAKVVAAIEPADHGGQIDHEALQRALADAIICTCGVANKLPDPINLADAVDQRFAEIKDRQSPLHHQKA